MRDEATAFFEKITGDYSLELLNWAYRKLGDGEKAEELAQEVLLQVFSAAKRDFSLGLKIEKPENYVRKIARYVWCRYLRKNTGLKNCVPIEGLLPDNGEDFVSDIAESEEKERLIGKMRHAISRLDFLHREIMISFYIDAQSVERIAKKLSISEAAVKWHLFDTRKKLKKEIMKMDENGYVYRPGKLHMAISGVSVPAPDTEIIEHSLSKQNICLACYHKARSADDLSESLGIPRAYVEDDLRWLENKEFVTRVNRKYATAFMIETCADGNEKLKIFKSHAASFFDAIADGLLEAEKEIRKLGFYGCDTPMDKLLWFLIYNCCGNMPEILAEDEVPEFPVRPDGGRYFPLGFDSSDYTRIDKAIDTRGWDCNGSMYNHGFRWYGLYNFGDSKIEEVMFAYSEEDRKLRDMLKTCVDQINKVIPDKLGEEDRYLLSKLIENGFVRVQDGIARPAFYVFTKEQYQTLCKNVFRPINEKLSGELAVITDELRAYFKGRVPAQLKAYSGLFVKMGLIDIGFTATVLAFNRGLLYVPKDKKDGEFLTFAYVG